MVLVAILEDAMPGQSRVIVDKRNRVQTHLRRRNEGREQPSAGRSSAVNKNSLNAISSAVEVPDEADKNLLFRHQQQGNEQGCQHDHPTRNAMGKKEGYGKRNGESLRGHAQHSFSLPNAEEAVGEFVSAFMVQQA